MAGKAGILKPLIWPNWHLDARHRGAGVYFYAPDVGAKKVTCSMLPWGERGWQKQSKVASYAGPYFVLAPHRPSSPLEQP